MVIFRINLNLIIFWYIIYYMKFDSFKGEKIPEVKPIELKKELYYVGLKGSKIEEFQKKLIEKGFLNSEITGFFGEKTFAAVKKFQKTNNLNPDGIIGPDTINKLMEENKESEKDNEINKNIVDLNKNEIKLKKSFMMKGTYESPEPSVVELSDFINEMKMNGYKLENITVDTSIKEAIFTALNSKNETKSIRLPVNIGSGGAVEKKLSTSKDEKTPLTGTEDFFLIGRDRVGGIRSTVADKIEEAVIARDGSANLGAAFVGFDAVNKKGINRGVGFHGHYDNILAPTNGCIRMYNDDLLLLYPFMNPGVKVHIV